MGVYMTVAAQLLLTGMVAAFWATCSPQVDWPDSQGVAAVLGILISNLGFHFKSILRMPSCQEVAERWPRSHIFLFMVTAFEGVMVGEVCIRYPLASVAPSLVSTVCAVAGLTLYARLTKNDFR